MLRLYGASARSARARRTYDRIMTDRPWHEPWPGDGAPRRGPPHRAAARDRRAPARPSAISVAYCPTSYSHADV